ncbi:MAG: DUF1566 domain-containing protein [Campylobacterales bacterium]|nr:DUF1566 domain-containing protein [Campylobacterales bacterium]
MILKHFFEGFGYQDANIALKLLVGTSGTVDIPCTYTINDPSQYFTASGGTHSVTVSASPANCNMGSWNSSENLSWAAFTGTTSGSGNGTWNVAYSVDSVAVPVGRIGAVTIAGSSHTLYQRGIANQQGMVFDERTGFYWQDEIYTVEENTAYNQVQESGKVLNWDHAQAYCKARTQADLLWTLPTITQLSGIVETSNTPTIAPAFQNPQSGLFWSATSTGSTTANSLDFTDGDVGAGLKTYPNYVRCVGRKGGVNPSLIMYLLQ